MKHRLFITGVLTAVCLLFSLAKTPVALAQTNTDDSVEPLNLTLTPISIQLLTTPGKSLQNEFKIRNNTSQTEKLRLYITPFTADSTGSKPTLRAAKPEDVYLQWLQFSETRFEVKPGEWKTVPFTFSPPADAQLSYYFSVVILRDIQLSGKESETQIVGGPALLVLATVDTPNAKKELRVEKVWAEYPLAEYLPQRIHVTLKNEGNVHVVPFGNVFIDSQNQKDLAVLPFNKEAGAILPGTSRTYVTEWSGGFPMYQETRNEAGDITGRKLAFDWSKANTFRFGKYTANVLVVYDNGQKDIPIESHVSFWVVPWKLCLALIVVIGLVLLGARSALLPVFSWSKSRLSSKKK